MLLLAAAEASEVEAPPGVGPAGVAVEAPDVVELAPDVAVAAAAAGVAAAAASDTWYRPIIVGVGMLLLLLLILFVSASSALPFLLSADAVPG